MHKFRQKPPTDREQPSPISTFDPVPSIPKALYRDPDPNPFAAMSRAPKHPRLVGAEPTTFSASQPSPSRYSRKRKLNNASTSSANIEPPASQDTAMAKKQKVAPAVTGTSSRRRSGTATNNHRDSLARATTPTRASSIMDYMSSRRVNKSPKSPSQNRLDQISRIGAMSMAALTPAKIDAWTAANTAANTSAVKLDPITANLRDMYPGPDDDYYLSSSSDEEILNRPTVQGVKNPGAHKDSDAARYNQTSPVDNSHKESAVARGAGGQETYTPGQMTLNLAELSDTTTDESEAEPEPPVREPSHEIDGSLEAYDNSPTTVKQAPQSESEETEDDSEETEDSDDESQDGESDAGFHGNISAYGEDDDEDNRQYEVADFTADQDVFDSSQWANGPNEGGLLGSDYEVAESSSESSEEDSSSDDDSGSEKYEDSRELDKAAASQIEQEHGAANAVPVDKAEGPEESSSSRDQSVVTDESDSEVAESDLEQDEHENEPSKSPSAKALEPSEEEAEPQSANDSSIPPSAQQVAAPQSNISRSRTRANNASDDERSENTAIQSSRKGKQTRRTKAQKVAAKNGDPVEKSRDNRALPAAADNPIPRKRTSSKAATAKVTGSLTDDETEKLMEVVEAFAKGKGLTMDEAGALVRAKIPDKNCPGGPDAQKQLWELIHGTFDFRKAKPLTAMVKRKFKIYGTGQAWTRKDDAKLRELAEKYTGNNKWVLIGEEMGRYSEACRDRHRNHATTPNKDTGKWTPAQLGKLFDALGEIIKEATEKHRKAKAAGGQPGSLTFSFDWMRVSKLMGGKRSRQQCLFKWTTLRIDPSDKRVRKLLCDYQPGLSPTLRACRMQLYSMKAAEAADIVLAVGLHNPDEADRNKPIAWRNLRGGEIGKTWLIVTLGLLWKRLRNAVPELHELPDQVFAQEIALQEWDEEKWLGRICQELYMEEEELAVAKHITLSTDASLKLKKSKRGKKGKKKAA